MGFPKKAASWTEGRLQACAAAKDLMADAVTLLHPRSNCQVSMFPDTFECHWGSFVTQVHGAEMQQRLPVEDMTHEPLAFLSGDFKGSQMRWKYVVRQA
ncbi:unnamed protein product, partial [Sphacelaria rigidula]